MIGLSDSVWACLFDLDSVLTRAAELHASAWKEMFDGYLSERAVRTEEHFHSFGSVAEYANGKPRHDGVQSFLTARSIGLPEGWHRGVLRGPHRRGGSLVAEREGLKGKPAPDTFPAAARALGVAPGQAAVFEDALGGVAAGRAGGFDCVVGVDRIGQAEALCEHGASIVVSALCELLEDR